MNKKSIILLQVCAHVQICFKGIKHFQYDIE